ncbi:lipase family protein [Conexibacter sp. SYSU D00693]|uniref:lipase family protein n=1 Tax=Conexibacter sp. SYSU D00693 TaxID=2812560 RepID=UPI00196B1EA0|nr:lipase family protein [Conexibacter sp. SYSU D00693]
MLLARLLLLAALAAAPVAGPAAAALGAVPVGPAGDAFYDPPADLVPGRPGTVVWRRPAAGLAALDAAARTDVVVFRSRALDGRPIVQSATVAVPHGAPPRGGWPVVSFFHVTTGGADSCAPSRVTPDNPELERLTRADTVVARLLRAGVAVARPDGEGIGTPGRHPYLVGRSLARSQSDAVRAARGLDRRIGRRWVAMGHSEGGVASLWSADLGARLAPELDLRAVAAFSPVTRTAELVDLLRLVPLATPPVDGLTALASLIITGAAEADPQLRAMLTRGALSPAAVRLLPHVEDRCLVELTRRSSWGGLAPAQVPGPAFAQARPILLRVLRENDVRRADLRRVPVRIDHGALDLVAPLPLTEELVLGQRARGALIALRRWPTATHVDVADDGQAAGAAVRWVLARLSTPART